jgi:ribosomal protein L15
MEIIETFSILFDCLSFSLEQNKQINYSQDPVPNESAIGIILNKLPTYKGYLKKKIKSDYRERRCWLSKKQNPVVNKSGFENTIKKLIALAELSSQYFARYQRAFIRSSLSKTRKWIFKAIAHLEKEKKTCMINMRSSSENYSEKLKEFMNDFSWKRFFHYLKILSQGVAKVSEKKLSKSAKEKIEDFFKHPVKVSRLVCIENLYLSEISHKKVTTRLSNHSKSLDDVKDLFSSFLTLQNTSSSVVEGKKRFKHQTILSRSSNF